MKNFVQRHENMLMPVFLLMVMSAFLGLSESNQSSFLYLNHLANHLPNTFWAHVTVLGDTLVALVLGLIFFWNKPGLLRAVLLAALIATLFSHTLKPFLDVARPPGILHLDSFHTIGSVWSAHSYPSGHTVTIATLLGLAVFYFKQQGHWLALALIAALFIGMSRVAVGVHWPADVLAGVAIGWFSAWAGIALNDRLSKPSTSHIPWYLIILNALFVLLLLWEGVDDYPQTRLFVGLVAIVGLIIIFRMIFENLTLEQMRNLNPFKKTSI
jgi:membrane-associated phospholipid phosphatase